MVSDIRPITAGEDVTATDHRNFVRTVTKPDNLAAMEKFLGHVNEYRGLQNRREELRKEEQQVDKRIASLGNALPGLYGEVYRAYPNIMPVRAPNAQWGQFSELGDLVLKFYHQELRAWESAPVAVEELYGVEA